MQPDQLVLARGFGQTRLPSLLSKRSASHEQPYPPFSYDALQPGNLIFLISEFFNRIGPKPTSVMFAANDGFEPIVTKAAVAAFCTDRREAEVRCTSLQCLRCGTIRSFVSMTANSAIGPKPPSIRTEVAAPPRKKLTMVSFAA